MRRIDGYWAATDEVTAERVASLASLEAIADRYGRDDEWAEELPDLGENG